MERNNGISLPLCFGFAFLGVAFAQQDLTDIPTGEHRVAYVSNGGDATGNGGSLSLIDTETLKVVRTLPVGGAPIGIVFSPGGGRAYVANSSSNTVSVLNTRTLNLVATLTVLNNPQNFAITPDGNFLYVISLSSGSISVVNTKTNSVVATVSVPTQRLLSIAITPDGRFAYATDCCTGNNVTVIDTKTNTVATQIPLAGGPSGIAITDDGRFAFVEDTVDVSVINTETNTVVATIPGAGGCGPVVALSPDGKTAYVEDYCGNRISIIDTRTLSVATTLSVNTPIGAAFNASGSLMYILDNNCVAFPCTVPGSVSVLETATNRILGTVNVGLNPQVLAITPRHPADVESR